MAEKITCAKAPCKSCPYRRDVPSGVWAASEYNKLPAYDGSMLEQMTSGGRAAFFCHQQNGKLCSGWVGAHGAHNLISLRLIADKVDPSVWEWKSPVPLFSSGAEAARHGKRDIKRPKAAAGRVIERLLKKQARRKA